MMMLSSPYQRMEVPSIWWSASCYKGSDVDVSKIPSELSRYPVPIDIQHTYNQPCILNAYSDSDFTLTLTLPPTLTLVYKEVSNSPTHTHSLPISIPIPSHSSISHYPQYSADIRLFRTALNSFISGEEGEGVGWVGVVVEGLCGLGDGMGWEGRGEGDGRRGKEGKGSGLDIYERGRERVYVL